MNTVRSVLKWFNGLVKPSKKINSADNKPIVNMLSDEEILTDDEDDDVIYWRGGGDKRSYSQNFPSPPNSPPFKRIALNNKPLSVLSMEKLEKNIKESEENYSEPAESVNEPAEIFNETVKSDNDDKPLTTTSVNDCLSLIANEILIGIIDNGTEVEGEQPNMIDLDNDNALYLESMPLQLMENLSNESDSKETTERSMDAQEELKYDSFDALNTN